MTPRLGIRQNLAQFSILVLVNAFVGAMVGLERAILPAIAEDEFGLAAKSAVLSFIVVFGLTKAAANYVAGRMSDAWGRKVVLVGGWLVALPVPFLLMWAPSWGWVVATNALLGISQGLTWSTTVIMKIDLAGPKQRGLAMGLNESAGYLAVGLSALATGYVATRWGLRPEPFLLGVGFAVLGTLLSVFVVRETQQHVAHEAASHGEPPDSPQLSQRQVFARTSLTDPELSSVSQAGFVNNLNDGMAWGLFPLVFAAAGMSLAEVGWLAALYPAVWGLGQLVTGAASDHWGRKGFIVAGMWIQAAGIALVALSTTFVGFAVASVLLGAGTAMVYPTLLAVIGDVAHPTWRASAVGVYRLWRDSGYAAGALAAGVIADAYGLGAAVWSIAALTMISGAIVLVRMGETLRAEPVAPSKCLEVDELDDFRRRGEEVVILDVRSPEEHASGHIDGARSVPVDELADRLDEVPRSAKVITACGTGGGRSDQAASLLREWGWNDVRPLCGGTRAWLEAHGRQASSVSARASAGCPGSPRSGVIPGRPWSTPRRPEPTRWRR